MTEEKKIPEWEKDFIEKGAILEHARWASWQKYLHSLCSAHPDGSLSIPVERVKHWERQIATPYEALSEDLKEYDRIEVRKYLPLIQKIIKEQIRLAVIEYDRELEIEKIFNYLDGRQKIAYQAVGQMDNTPYADKRRKALRKVEEVEEDDRNM